MNRTYIIKLISGLSALSLLTVPFTGCEKMQSSSVPTQDSSSEDIAAVTEAQESEPDNDIDQNIMITDILPEHEYENINQVELVGGKYYIYEQMSDVTEKEISVTASASSKEIKDLDISDAGYSYVQYAALGDNELVLVYSDEENAQHICSVDPDSGKKSSDVALGEENYLSALRNNGSDEYTYISINYTDTGKNMDLVWFKGSDLSVTRKEELNKKLELPDTALVVDAVSVPDGSAYICSVDYKMDLTTEYVIYRMDSKGDVTYKKTVPADWKGLFSGMYVSESGNLCYCNTEDYSQFFVYEINCETGELIADHTVETAKQSNYVGTISLPGYDFTCITSAGITGYSFAENKSEVVLKFGEDLDPLLKNVFTATSHGDQLYLYTLASIESGRTVTVAGSDGGEIFTADLTTDTGYASAFCAAPDGSVYYCETYDQPDENGSSANVYRFHVLDSTGNAKRIFTIDELKEASNGNVISMRFGGDGNLYLLVQTYDLGYPYTTIYVTDTEGNLKGKFSGEKEQLVITGMLVTGEAQRAVCINADSDYVIVNLDLEKQLMTEEFRLTQEDSMAEDIVCGTGEYDLYYIREKTVYGYNSADGSETAIVSVDSDDVEPIVTFVDSGKRALCTTYDQETGKTGVSIFEKG